MAVVRELFAERLSPLKKRLKIETPILDEVPLPAKIISSEAMQLTEALGIIPMIARGKAYGEVAGAWYRVAFARSLVEPSVVVVGEARAGAIPSVAAPKITIPIVGVPATSVAVQAAVPVATVAVQTAIPVDIPVTLIPYLNESFPYLASDIYWVQEQICKPINKIVESLYRAQSKINDVIGRINDGYSKIKKGFENTNTSISDLRTKTNTAVSNLRSNTNVSIEDLRRKTQDALNSGDKSLRDNVQLALNTSGVNTQDSVNKGLAALIPALYAAWGLPSTMTITPIHIRNVTSTGFEFQSYGKTTCYYIAIGSRF